MRTLQLPPTVRPLLSAAIGATVLGVALAGNVVPAQADEPVVPLNSQVTIVGAGWGHGRGMSQYGAYGAASSGLDYTAIVGFYYPGTELSKLDAGNTVRVWLTADTDAKLHFRKVSGLQVRDDAGTTLTLPTSSKYTKWRINKSGSNRVLYYRNKSGKYVKLKNKLQPAANWYVANPRTGTVKLALPSGETKSYRGSLGLAFTAAGARTVNYVAMEDYLRSVVPAEMPASWATEAVKAQSVAARTYAARLRAKAAAGSGYDLCDTSACQVYKGLAWEHAASDRAIAATADQVLLYQGQPAMTEFSSSNGGWSAAGGADQPYLKSQPDPYDGVKRDQTWQVTVSTSKLAKLFPGIGALTSVQVLTRDGNGTYGGRVESVQLTGSAGALTVTGADFKRKLGLKERLFTVSTGTATTLARK
ncbi:MAG TPA: SpoIID/LytB domain-containing protein [Propionicimonas sp.]|nr:SpoIID/LytB domain-containing protein [Propionicimonas sp.]HQA77507.1 SpoIID/LytB domain-containing protein [Propionicimonas sp.]HQD96096.1 SpoIID/LytB domain-containing protein [Propionicimonas sp.]